MLQFREICLADKEKIYEFYALSGSLGTNYSITTLCGWQGCNQMQICVSADFLILKINKPGDVRFLSPLAKDMTAYCAAVDGIVEYMGKDSVKIMVVSTEQAELLTQKGFECENVRAHAEYLYKSEELISLKGKKYNSKRNFINNFPAPFSFREYRKEDYEGVMELFLEWQEQKSAHNGVDELDKQIMSSEWERQVAQAVLADTQKYNVFADILEVEGKIAGFCLGERLPTNVGAIYFQKADISYRGIYPLLDNLFIKKHFSDLPFVNKQEDMGLEGLRKSKMSYHPYMLVERWKAVKN